MSKQLLLAPCSNPRAQRHFNDAVIAGINIEFSGFNSNQSIWPSLSLGTGPGDENRVRQMETGDVVLFYVGNRTSSHQATVLDTEYNEELDDALWTPYEDR